MAKNPPANSESDDLDATAFVSAQRGAPLPMDSSEDTVVNVRPRKAAPEAKTAPANNKHDTQIFPVEETTVVISDSTVEVNEATVVLSGKNPEVADATELDSGDISGLNESTTVSGSAKLSEAIPVKKRHGNLTAKASEQTLDEISTTAFQERIKPFDPTTGNEQFREQAVRVVATNVASKLPTGNLKNRSHKMKTGRTSEQIWQKNQQRRVQTKTIFGILVLSMAALGAAAAYLLASLPI